jgi:hypothetical protein
METGCRNFHTSGPASWEPARNEGERNGRNHNAHPDGIGRQAERIVQTAEGNGRRYYTAPKGHTRSGQFK